MTFESLTVAFDGYSSRNKASFKLLMATTDKCSSDFHLALL